MSETGRSVFGGAVRRVAGVLAALLLLLLAGMAIKMVATPSRQPAAARDSVAPVYPEPERLAMAERLGQALRIPTISVAPAAIAKEGGKDEDKAQALASMRRLHAHLQASFPAAHAVLEREEIEGQSLLYTWKGSDASLAPYLLAAHLDVVPVEAGTDGRWHQPAYSGVLAEGFIWGRGALDDKVSVLGILEAVERLVKAGYKPRRTVYFGFGHDEEVGGLGAQAIVARLVERGVRLDFVLDEGQVVVQGILPGIKGPVALIGLAEKGHVSVEVAVSAEGGHSSMPPRHTAAGLLARALTRIEEHQLPARVAGAPRLMFEHVASEMPLPLRFALTNLWLLEPVLAWGLSQGPTTNAVVRTTTAITMLEGSPKDNVLPQRARAIVNFRILPGETVGSVTAHVRRVVDDPGVEVKAIAANAWEASATSSASNAAFARIAGSIRVLFPDAVVAPSLMLGASDGRHYAKVTDSIYRFLPILLRSEDLARLHGTDERIAISDYARAVGFYEHLLRGGDQ